jgi:hypothetical protein
MLNPKLRHAVMTMIVLISVTGSSMMLLTGAAYLLLKAASKDEQGFSLAAAILSPSVALFFLLSLGLGLYVSHVFYRRITVRAARHGG